MAQRQELRCRQQSQLRPEAPGKAWLQGPPALSDRPHLQGFFYNKKHIQKKTVILKKKDIIMLIKGAHGFKVIENLEMLEIKQGPFTGDKDKARLKDL